jgi:small GTP-binding protein
MIKKVCVLGDPSVGKTSIINRYVKNVFSPEYLSTIGANISTKELEVDGGKLIFSIWDIAGQQTSRSLSASHYAGSEGAIFVYDLTSQDSFDGLISWEHQLKKSIPKDVPRVLIGNKADMVVDIKDVPQDRLPPGFKFKSNFFIASAKTGESVEEAFAYLGEQILKKML